MLLEPGSDLEFFRETTARFLAEQMPAEEVRRLRDEPSGFDRAYWRRGAELGWTSLLVREEDGGGSISGDGLLDLTVVAHEFGRHAAPGPLVSTNVVAGALSRVGGHPELIAGILAGDSIPTWCLSEGVPHDRPGDVALEVVVEGSELVVNGAKRPVESADVADHFLVSGRSPQGLTQLLVPADTPGVSWRAMRGVDLTRRYFVVSFDQVRLPLAVALGDIGGAKNEIEQQFRTALVMLNAEAVGAMHAAFDLTLEWAMDRYSFGRPLASYQAIKHRLADMKSWLEASHAISDTSAAALAASAPDAAELLSAAKAFIGEYGSELMQECVQLHGGIGVTYEHDLHLSLRRHTVARALCGTPADHRRRLADLVIQYGVPA